MQQCLVNQAEQCVRDIMSTPVHSIDMDDSILNVKSLFEREGCHHVIVMKGGLAHGVVSDRDILKELSPFVGNKMMERSQDINTLKKRVHQIMSRDLITIKSDETIAATAEKMLQESVSCILVVDDNDSALGIVTVRDFLKWSLGQTGVKDKHKEGPDQDDGILVIIDGNRCYCPDTNMAQLIREAESRFNTKHGNGSARAKHLPITLDTASLT